MKHADFNSAPARLTHSHQQRGFMMIALLVIVALMLMYVAASSRTLYQLQRDLSTLDRIQVKRLAHSPPAAIPAPKER